MKRLINSNVIANTILWVVCVMFAALPNVSYAAKLKTASKSTASALPRGLNPPTQGDNFSYLYCEGQETRIEEDDSGNTIVKIKNANGTFETISNSDSWANTYVVLGYEENKACGPVNLTVTGGYVCGIVLANHDVNGKIVLNATGGTLTNIGIVDDAVITTTSIGDLITINLSNAGVDHMNIPAAYRNRTKLFIDNTCTFTTNPWDFVPGEISEYRAVVIPNKNDLDIMESYGKSPAIPEGYSVLCWKFYDYATTSGTGAGPLVINGKLGIRDCGGWYSSFGRTVSNYNGTATGSQKKIVIPSHSYDDGYVSIQPTCTATGTRIKTCKTCGSTKSESIAALGHYECANPPIKEGCIQVTTGTHCERCGLVMSSTSSRSGSHSYGEYTIRTLTGPCTGQFKSRTCSDCGWVDVANTTMNAKHSGRKSSTTLSAATCTDKEIIQVTCSGCRRKWTEFGTTVEHTVIKQAAIAATCTEVGYKEWYKCSICLRGFRSSSANPSDRFGTKAKEGIKIMALGHQYVKNSSTDPIKTYATCTKPQVRCQKCTRCGTYGTHTYNNGTPLGHNPSITKLSYDVMNLYDGEVYIGCSRTGCSTTWGHLYFTNRGTKGSPSTDGYSYSTIIEPNDVTKLPTCKSVGSTNAKFQMTFHGKNLTYTYTRTIPTFKDNHEYSNIGYCSTHGCSALAKQCGVGKLKKYDEYNNAYYVIDIYADSYTSQVDFAKSQWQTSPSGKREVHTYTSLDLSVGAYARVNDGCTWNNHGYSSHNFTDGHEVNNYVPGDATFGFTYQRNFLKTCWQALFVPFKISVSDLKNKGLTVAAIKKVNKNTDGSYSIVIEYLESGYTAAGTPYFIRPNSTGQKNITLSGTDLTWVNNPLSFDVDGINFTFTGTYKKVDGSVMCPKKYYAMSDGVLSRVANNSVSLGSQRWYLSITKNGEPVSSAPAVRFAFEDEMENITSLQTIGADESESIYTLDGLKVNQNSQMLKPGMYVKNGKKITIR